MPFQITCLNCRVRLEVPDHAENKSVVCPGCNSTNPATRTSTASNSTDGEIPSVAPIMVLSSADLAGAPKTTSIQTKSTMPTPVGSSPAMGAIGSANRPRNLKKPRAVQSSGSVLAFLLLGALAFCLISAVGAGVAGWWVFRDRQVDPIARGDELVAEKVGEVVVEKAGEVVAKKNALPDPIRMPSVLPAIPNRITIQPPKLASETTTLTLPDAIRDVVIGGGGRFLICHIPKTRQLAVFDANEGKIVKFLPVAGDDAHIAAGMTKLIVVYPGLKIVQRWDLLTLERDRSEEFKFGGETTSLCIGMGYGSDGPLLVQVEGKKGNYHYFLDVHTLKPLDLKFKRTNEAGGPEDFHFANSSRIRGSADGRIVAVGTPHGAGLILTLNDDNTYIVRPTKGNAPSADGMYVLGSEVHDSQGKMVDKRDKIWCVPALQGNYYLGVPYGAYRPQEYDFQKKRFRVSLFLVGDSRPIIELPDVENSIREGFTPPDEALQVPQRYHFIPEAKLLVTIPQAADKLFVRRFDVDDALEKSGIDYLLVDSAPFPFALRGREYQFPVRVKSKKGLASCVVDTGPAGMKSSQTGLVTWNVPADHPVGVVEAALSIRDVAGQAITHAFKVMVTSELPPGIKPPIARAEKTIDQGKPKKDEPAIVAAPAIKPPVMTEKPLVVPVSHQICRICLGGGGRFFVLHLRKENKLALVDVNEAKIVHHYVLEDEDIRFAASLHKLIIYYPKSKKLQRWDLLSRERELTVAFDGGLKEVFHVLVGSASTGPLVISGRRDDWIDSHEVFLDLNSLKPLPIIKDRNCGDGLGAFHAFVSANGLSFGTSGRNSPSGMQLLELVGNELRGQRRHINGHPVIPGPDGQYFYTGAGTFNSSCDPIATGATPAVHGQFCFSGAKDIAIYRAGDGAALVTIPDPFQFPPKTKTRYSTVEYLPLRRFLIPDAKVFVAITDDDDGLVFSRLDIYEELEKAGVSYLFIESTPPRMLHQGANLTYSIQVKSRKGGVTFKLESAPEGMVMSKAGIITWNVPLNYPVGNAKVIATVQDESGREVFHNFTIRVVAPGDPAKKQ